MKIKIFSILAACTLICSFAGCSSNSKKDTSDETYNFEEADQHYGDVVHDDNESFSLPMEYDSRFITNDIASSVADYFYAVQTKNLDLYKTVTIEEYQSYLINEVYASENYDEQSFLDALYNGIKNQSGDNFNIKLISVTNFDNDENTSGAKDIIQLLSDLTGDDYSEKVEEGAKLTLSFTVSAGGEEYEKTNQNIFILKIDEKYKIITA